MIIYKNFFFKPISYFFIILFIYASISKILDFENFQVQIGQSPVLSAYANIISYLVIGTELITVICLCFGKSRLIGLYISTSLMSSFTIYIYLILNYSDFVPCSCGGVLEKLGWKQHLIFNIICVIFGSIAILIQRFTYLKTIKNTVFYLLITNILSTILVIILFLSSEYIIKKDNNFTRRFLLHPISEIKSIKLNNTDYYFAGSENNTIFLGNRKYPLSLTKTNYSLTKILTKFIRLENSNFNFKNISIAVKENNFFVFDGTVPIIYKGNIANSTANIISFQDAYFSNLIILDSTHFIIRSQSAITKSFILGELNLIQSKKLKIKNNILQKQIDGVFDVDGVLLYDQPENKLAYVYAYRNQFIIMNDQLDVLARLNTIDTVKNAQIKSIELSDGSHKMNKPPLKVNNNAFVYRGLLFNHSVLKGRNESISVWKNADIIDVYKTNDQQYIGSFYLYRKNGKKLKEFYLVENSLYTIQDDILTKYTISKQITKYFKKGEAENPNKE